MVSLNIWLTSSFNSYISEAHAFKNEDDYLIVFLQIFQNLFNNILRCSFIEKRLNRKWYNIKFRPHKFGHTKTAFKPNYLKKLLIIQ